MGAEESKPVSEGSEQQFSDMPEDIIRCIREYLPQKSLLSSRLISQKWGGIDAALWSFVAIQMQAHKEGQPAVDPDKLRGFLYMFAGWVGGVGTAVGMIGVAAATPTLVFIPLWLAVEQSTHLRNAIVQTFLSAYRIHDQGRLLWEKEITVKTF
eukprot:Sspe_Gene.118691::Locus_112742_Transcript_1_1_Confidence_1.000_Length_523::g.118691::m.118691